MELHSTHNIDALAKPMLFFMLPVVFGNLLQIFFNTADVIIVGRYAGAEALAAVGATTSLINMLVKFFIGLTMGITVVIAQSFAAKDEKALQQYLHTGMSFSILFGITAAILGTVFRGAMLKAVAVPENIYSQSAVYLQIYLIGIPAVSVYNACASVLRSYGDSRRPTVYLLIAGVINIILNLVFVIVFGLGVMGVAIATTISNYISVTLALIRLFRTEDWLSLKVGSMRIHKSSLKRILTIGLPSAIHSCMFGISNIIMASAINSLGATVIAGDAAAVSVESLCYTVIAGMCTTVLTFYSQTAGAMHWSRTKQICITGGALGAAVYAAAAVPAVILIRPLIGLYSSVPEVIDVGIYRAVFMLCAFFLEIPMDVYSHALRAVGHSLPPMVISIAAICGFRILWLAAVFPLFHTYTAILVVGPVSWIIATIAFMWYYPKVRRLYPVQDVTADR